MNYLVTGAAGFIGMHLCKRLSAHDKNKVIGINSAGISESKNRIIQNVGYSVPINYFNL